MNVRHLFAFPILLLALTACPKDDGDDTGDTGDSGAMQRVSELGDCWTDDQLEAASPWDFVTLSIDGFVWDVEPAVLSSQADLDAWQTEHGLTVDAADVDFASHVILFSGVSLSSTCGAGDAVWHVVELNGGPHLSFELTNPGGACEAVCDMAWTEHRIIAVEKSGSQTATVCAREIETCDE